MRYARYIPPSCHCGGSPHIAVLFEGMAFKYLCYRHANDQAMDLLKRTQEMHASPFGYLYVDVWENDLKQLLEAIG